MKRICLLLTLITLLISCARGNDGRNLKTYQVKGNVKSITEQIYYAKYVNGEPVQPPASSLRIKTISNFNEQNECTDETYILANGDTLVTIVNEYENGLLVNKNVYDTRGNFISVEKSIRINENETELEIHHLSIDKIEKGIAVYENGYQVRVTYPKREYTYTYDKDGNRTGYKNKEIFGELTSEIEYLEYDDEGNWTIKIERRDGYETGHIYVTRAIEYYY